MLLVYFRVVVLLHLAQQRWMLLIADFLSLTLYACLDQFEWQAWRRYERVKSRRRLVVSQHLPSRKHITKNDSRRLQYVQCGKVCKREAPKHSTSYTSHEPYDDVLDVLATFWLDFILSPDSCPVKPLSNIFARSLSCDGLVNEIRCDCDRGPLPLTLTR